MPACTHCIKELRRMNLDELAGLVVWRMKHIKPRYVYTLAQEDVGGEFAERLLYTLRQMEDMNRSNRDMLVALCGLKNAHSAFLHKVGKKCEQMCLAQTAALAFWVAVRTQPSVQEK